MKLVLILMIRNESRILKRCLEAVENLVDAFCICDTGSTDNTCEIADEFLKTHTGCLSKTEWRDFGHNRTLSFQAAQTFVRDSIKWDPKECYGLLLDADMVFVPGKLKEQTLTEIGYTIIQCAGSLEYPNCRVIRMDYDWKCRGVTHEYWDGPTRSLPKSICYIDDRNDGGCKSDKFERDARLLEKGLEEEPNNVRYMFYLAQTYHSLGRWHDSIKMYKKRITAGGWDEEVWYSHYMIAQCHERLGDAEKFEQWMLRAYKKRPTRAEPIYKLARYFRERAQHYKSYHYIKLGKSISIPNDALFIEKDVYTKLFDYEATIIDYYIFSDKSIGLKDSIKYLLNNPNDNVISNLKFYVEPISSVNERMDIPRDAFGGDFHPTSVSLYTKNSSLYYNVRFVNYEINPNNGSYIMTEDGKQSGDFAVRTQNAWYNPQTKHVINMNDETVSLPKRPTHIRGLEDVRIFEKSDGLYFTATTLEYSPKLRIMYGRYHPTTGSYSDCKIIDSPYGPEFPCEKNWLGIPFTENMIYNWYPLQIGSIEGNELKIHTRHETPSFFERIRGSAVPFRINNELWTLTHFVEYSAPRKYYHMFVVLDANTYKPTRISMPFVFGSATIEYCIGSCWTSQGIVCLYSTMDNNPAKTVIDPTVLKWIDV
jgi:glycosyltransferase involved in cell wall biosynthesis